MKGPLVVHKFTRPETETQEEELPASPAKGKAKPPKGAKAKKEEKPPTPQPEEAKEKSRSIIVIEGEAEASEDEEEGRDEFDGGASCVEDEFAATISSGFLGRHRNVRSMQNLKSRMRTEEQFFPGEQYPYKRDERLATKNRFDVAVPTNSALFLRDIEWKRQANP